MKNAVSRIGMTIIASAAMAASFAMAQDTNANSPEETPAKQGDSLDQGGGSDLYTVKDGNKVDDKTLQGWRTWRALACERCHGAQQEGLVGPPLVESLKRLSKEEFHTVMMEGRPEKGMPPFKTSEMVTKNWEGLYAYLKGRSDGKIKPGRLSALNAP